MTYREEKDSMGEIEVPEDAYYGAFSQRAKDNFQLSGENIHPEFIRALGVIKEAAAQANQELEMLETKQSKAIIQAAREVRKGEHNDQFVVDAYQAGAGTPTNMNANEVIANRATEILGGEKGQYKIHPNNHVNLGQSSNNVIPTAIRIASLSLLDGLEQELEELEEVLMAKAEEFRDIIKTGRTHMQDAVPLLLGQEFEAFAEYTRRSRKRLENSRDGLLELGIGGTAVGTKITASPEFDEVCVKHIRKITGEDYRSTKSHIYLTQSVDAFMSLSSALRELANDMLKVCDDLVLMSSGPRAGLQEVNLPEVEPGSSIMPGKVNPSIVEAYKMVCFQVLGSDEIVSQTSREGQFELNVMTPVIAHNILKTLDLLINGTRMFRERCVEGIEANKTELERTFANSLSVATSLSPYLGYDMVAHLVKQALERGTSIKDVVLSHDLMTAEELEEVMDPAKLTGGRSINRELKDKIRGREAYRELSTEIDS